MEIRGRRTWLGRKRPASWPNGSAGQSTVEWVGLVTLLAGLMVALGVSGIAATGTAAFHSLSRSLLCAASLSENCLSEGSLVRAYGNEIAGQVRRHRPDLLFGPDMLGLPVDFRTCRSPACADGKGHGVVSRSTAGEPVTLFTRAIDCRDSRSEEGQYEIRNGDGSGAGGDSVECGGEGAGNLYIQYWAYYPESASLRGVPVLEGKGHHPHDWESFQVRIGPEGEVSQRASSHAGHNHGRSAVNWASDMGWGPLNKAAEATGLRKKGGWGPASGRLLVAGGSHAGNVEGPVGPGRYPSRTPAGLLRLVPLEEVRDGALARPADFDPITPPWQKEVWAEPEAEGTG